MNDLIKERDERTRKRKKTKRKMDSIIGLSYHDEDKHVMSLAPSNPMSLKSKSIRLLDEGYIDNGFVIKKGAMEKFLNGKNEKVRGYEMTEDGWQETDVLNLTDDFVGTVNLGHMDFATFPFIIGEWNKSDLTLVDIENDRKGIDVNLRLDNNSIFVKELKRQPYDIGISSEFWYSINHEDTESLSETLGYYIPVIDEIFIFAYGLVGECGNVNSSGLELKGDFDMKDNQNVKINLAIENADEIIDELNELSSEIEDETENNAADDIVIEPEAESTDVTETEEDDESGEGELSLDMDADNANEDDTDDDSSDVEETGSDEALDVEGDEANGDEDGFTGVESYVESLNTRINALESENAELKKTNKRLSKKLKAELDKKADFVSKFSDMTAKIGFSDAPKEAEADVTDYVYGDGIGE